jgi:hypothetical protein
VRRADAVARQQEMTARVTQSRAALVLAEAEIPAAIATAFRAGQFHARRSPVQRAERFEEGFSLIDRTGRQSQVQVVGR